MGCWSENCALSGMEIKDGQRIYFAVVSTKSDYKGNISGYGPEILIPPTLGNYDDYGGIDLLEDNALFGLKLGENFDRDSGEDMDEGTKCIVYMDADVFEYLYNMEPEFTYKSPKTIGTQLDKQLEELKVKAAEYIAAGDIDSELAPCPHAKPGTDDAKPLKVKLKWLLHQDFRDAFRWAGSQDTFKGCSLKAFGMLDNEETAGFEELLKFLGRTIVMRRGFMELRKAIPTYKAYGPQHGGEQALIPFYDFVLTEAKKRKADWDKEYGEDFDEEDEDTEE